MATLLPHFFIPLPLTQETHTYAQKEGEQTAYVAMTVDNYGHTWQRVHTVKG